MALCKFYYFLHIHQHFLHIYIYIVGWSLIEKVKLTFHPLLYFIYGMCGLQADCIPLVRTMLLGFAGLTDDLSVVCIRKFPLLTMWLGQPRAYFQAWMSGYRIRIFLFHLSRSSLSDHVNVLTRWPEWHFTRPIIKRYLHVAMWCGHEII